jgi:hypothetical protein
MNQDIGLGHSRSTLGDSSESLAKVLASTDEGDLEGVLANVVLVVGHGEDLGFLLSAGVFLTRPMR